MVGDSSESVEVDSRNSRKNVIASSIALRLSGLEYSPLRSTNREGTPRERPFFIYGEISAMNSSPSEGDQERDLLEEGQCAPEASSRARRRGAEACGSCSAMFLSSLNASDEFRVGPINQEIRVNNNAYSPTLCLLGSNPLLDK